MAEGTLDSVTVSMNWNETPDVVPANLSLSLIAPNGTTTKLGGGGPQLDYAITTELTSPAPTYPLDQGVLSTVTDCDDCTEVLQLGFAFPFYDDSWSTRSSSHPMDWYTWAPATYSSGCCSGWSLPSSQGPSIHLAHSDLHTGTNGDVRYHTIGTEPNRTFVLSFENVALIGAATLVDGQLLLHEADGRIELYHGGIPPGNYHTFTLGINAGDGVRASYEPAFHLTSSTSSAHFEWEPTLDRFPIGPQWMAIQLDRECTRELPPHQSDQWPQRHRSVEREARARIRRIGGTSR